MRKLPPQVISLIHYVELTKAGWWETTIERCVLGILWLLKRPAPISQLKKRIAKELNLHLKTGEIKQALERLERNQEIFQLNDGRWKLSLTTEQQLNHQVDEALQLEKSVREKFEQTMKSICPDLELENCWTLFTDKFLIPLITDAGVGIYEFFVIRRKKDEWVSHSDQFLEEFPEAHRDQISKAIFRFLDPDDAEVARFMLSYLDAYFLVTASGLSSKAARRLSELRKGSVEFIIFVDTNFIYSILGLHSNPLNQTANDLMELVKSVPDELDVKFVVSPVTLKETQHSIRHYRNQLGSLAYPPNVAEAAVKTEVSGIYATFFERVKASGRDISPQEYFVPYETDLVRILKEKGITLFTQGRIEEYERYPEVISDIGTQMTYEMNKYGQRAKSEMQITNDIVLWHFVRDQRDSQAQLPLEAKYWIVTVDYRFLIFDRYKSNKVFMTPICMLPSQFIQILRFFVPRSAQLEKMILSTVRFPLIAREFDPRAEEITLRILKQLTRFEGISDLSVETVQGVITDQALRSRLGSEPSISEAEEAEVIESALAQQLRDYEEVVRKKDKQIQELVKSIKTRDQEIEDLRSELRRVKEDLTRYEEEQQQLKESLYRQEQERKKVQEAGAKRRAIRVYVFQSLLIILPYPLVLAVIWHSMLSRVQLTWLAHLIAAVVTIGIATLVIRLLISLGKRDEYIARTRLFSQLTRKLRLTAMITFVVSVLWLIMTAVISEVVIRWVLP